PGSKLDRFPDSRQQQFFAASACDLQRRFAVELDQRESVVVDTDDFGDPDKVRRPIAARATVCGK
ncbi:MAG: hypothetical protein ABI674_06290, partial [Spartobacteria bacterium]